MGLCLNASECFTAKVALLPLPQGCVKSWSELNLPANPEGSYGYLLSMDHSSWENKKKKKKSLPCTSKIRIYNSLLGLYMFPWEISSSPLYPLAPKLQVLTENPVEDLENLLVVFAKEINQSSTLQFAMVSILAWLEGIRPESMLVTGKLLYK